MRRLCSCNWRILNVITLYWKTGKARGSLSILLHLYIHPPKPVPGSGSSHETQKSDLYILNISSYISIFQSTPVHLYIHTLEPVPGSRSSHETWKSDLCIFNISIVFFSICSTPLVYFHRFQPVCHIHCQQFKQKNRRVHFRCSAVCLLWAPTCNNLAISINCTYLSICIYVFLCICIHVYTNYSYISLCLYLDRLLSYLAAICNQWTNAPCILILLPPLAITFKPFNI